MASTVNFDLICHYYSELGVVKIWNFAQFTSQKCVYLKHALKSGSNVLLRAEMLVCSKT